MSSKWRPYRAVMNLRLPILITRYVGVYFTLKCSGKICFIFSMLHDEKRYQVFSLIITIISDLLLWPTAAIKKAPFIFWESSPQQQTTITKSSNISMSIALGVAECSYFREYRNSIPHHFSNFKRYNLSQHLEPWICDFIVHSIWKQHQLPIKVDSPNYH